MVGCAGEIAHRLDSGAERYADLVFENVVLEFAEEAELEGDVFADEEFLDDAESARLNQDGSEEGVSEGYGRGFELMQVSSE
jgi:hypothetical protein